jgi:hypothetical protein
MNNIYRQMPKILTNCSFSEAAAAAVALFNLPENAARLKAPELECEI